MNQANTDDNVVIVDENDIELGIISRQQAHRQGLLHRTAATYLTRPNGQILIQERISSHLDHSSAGHVDPGEDYLQAAKRELKEELGVECELIELGKTISNEIGVGDNHNRIRHIFKIFECQAEPGELAKDEVRSVFWADPLAIYKEMKNDPEHHKFCSGFKVSLQFYLKKKGLL
ncbi:NUDIX domain-containing protein [Candidatus Kuenenbacteria bacterium]|nr:NUDIX domain-containing protein [Candidatus Kuenenbacteria bacterium]